jgi:acetyl esterase/lipase
VIAKQASELVVFQRTPNFSVPAGHGPVPAERIADIKGRYPDYRQQARESQGGVPVEVTMDGVQSVSTEERETRLEAAWQEGDLIGFLSVFNDTPIIQESNDLVAEFVRRKIRGIVNDPETADALCPTDHPIGTKRLCLDDNYFATYNQPHVSLVNLRNEPISTVTKTGIETVDRSFEFDALVMATGFDAMTGAIVAVDIKGRDGIELKDKWAEGPETYLGLTVTDFPNFFAVTGPQSPSVLSNMAVSIEQHVEWITDCISDIRAQGFEVIEPTPTAQAGWQQHNLDCADITLFGKANSWYMGANVPGKARVFLPYVGGVGAYRQFCDEVVEQGYLGFSLAGAAQTQCNDGVIAQLQPDVSMVLAMMAEMGLPPIESMSPADAREFMGQSSAQRPPGPEVGEVVDGTFPGAAGALDYRLYRPDTNGPHPVVVYFHGGGWVLGDATSDDALCRDLCVQSDSIIISCDYRHAPEARFPAAVDDGYAAVTWASENLDVLGARPDPVVVAGWSAGANIAAVACQTARDAGGPAIAGQVLITPVTDTDFSRPSYEENADGYVLTRALMTWFMDHYCDPDDRDDPRVAPLRGNLAGLPPAFIATAQFDPLRDEGNAYVEALAAAGSDVEHLPLRGQLHTSVAGVGMIISANDARARIAGAIERLAAGGR